MSYDLSWCSQPDDVRTAPTPTERTRRQHDAGSFFRANVWTMAWLRQAMAARGMLAVGEPMAAPQPETFGLTDPIPWPNTSNDPRVQSCWQADEDWRTAGLDVPGIPVYKLCSNDYWVVTAEEIG